jgi:hypothetical protein
MPPLDTLPEDDGYINVHYGSNGVETIYAVCLDYSAPYYSSLLTYCSENAPTGPCT